MSKSRLAILASGRGSNLQALLDAVAAQRIRAEIVGVFSDQPNAAALQRVAPAQRWALRPKDCPSRQAYEARLIEAVAEVKPDWIICAGYMRILGSDFIRRFQGRILNIHPSLLPKYRGLNTHARALEAGDHEHGASVHFVTEELDAGAVIAQTVIAVQPDDTADNLAARLLPQEHRLLTAVVQLATDNRIVEASGAVRFDDGLLNRPLQLDDSGNWVEQNQ